MRPADRILKNSLLMVGQPLLLNILSLFAIGYIARVLGQTDYGRFTFAFALVAMLFPFANLGLRAVTVRHVAQHRDTAAGFIDTILSARIMLALLTVTAGAIGMSLTGYAWETKLVVYLALTTIVLQSATTTFYDVFEAHECLQRIALGQVVAGTILTILSVAVLFVGFRLTGLTVVYVVGSVLALVMAWTQFVRHHHRPAVAIDIRRSWQRIVEGAPFFVPSLIASAGSKVGIMILAGVSGDAAVGLYGAASGLVERLLIIPDGICSAFYPTMIGLYQRSPQEAGQLFRKFFFYLLLLGLPIAVGTTLLAGPILALVYGRGFADGARILQILAWWTFATFASSLQFWTLGAIHRERVGGLIAIGATVTNVLLSAILIPVYGATGAAAATLGSALLSFVLATGVLSRCLAVRLVDPRQLAKVVVAVAMMALVCWWLRHANVALVVAAGAAVYACAVWGFGIIDTADIQVLSGMFTWRNRRSE